MNRADVVIIGAGVIGTSIAFHLAKKGCQDVVVFEKNYIGSGSTEKCAGGIRQQFSLEANIRLSMESVQFFTNFESETGQTIDFHQHGYLILAETGDELETLCMNVELQRKLGLEVDILSPKEIIGLIPQLEISDIVGATFCRTDGYADPYSVVTGFASAARRGGVRIYESTEVIGIDVKESSVEGVVTTAGKFVAPVVVNAAGPYAGAIGRMVGLDIPVCPVRRHIFITEPVNYRTGFARHTNWSRLPMVVDFHDGFWFRREGPCLLIGKRNPHESEGFFTTVDWDFFARDIAPEVCHRVPGLGGIGIMRAQAGLHSDTTDDIAILGRIPGIDGLYLACGFSGHGFMHSPAVGRLMAELILEKGTSLQDIEFFNLERFQSPVQRKEKAVV